GGLITAETQSRREKQKKKELDVRSSAGGASPTLSSASSARQPEVWCNATNPVDALLSLPFSSLRLCGEKSVDFKPVLAEQFSGGAVEAHEVDPRPGSRNLEVGFRSARRYS